MCQTFYLCRFCDSVRPRYSTVRPWFDTSPRVCLTQPQCPLLPTARSAIASHDTFVFFFCNCAYICMLIHIVGFIHQPRCHPSQLQAVLYASAASSRIPANSVVALAAVIGSGSVGKIRITRGWRAWMPAKVSLAN